MGIKQVLYIIIITEKVSPYGIFPQARYVHRKTRLLIINLLICHTIDGCVAMYQEGKGKRVSALFKYRLIVPHLPFLGYRMIALRGLGIAD